jgi:hypothetical protein
VLLSVLIQTLREYKSWFDTAATAPASKTTFWTKLFGTKPSRPAFNKKEVGRLIARIQKQLSELEGQLHAAEKASVTKSVGRAAESTDSAQGSLGFGAGPAKIALGGSIEDKQSSSVQTTAKFKHAKIDFLHRNIIGFQDLFRHISQVSNGDAYLFLDDLYHIRKPDQADVIDYFHRIAKSNSVWLKIGTIRHRTEWYRHSTPPVGVKLGDDADEIDLDLTLEKYTLAKDFLKNVLRNIAIEAGLLEVPNILAGIAFDRLVLASGGVARDFLSLFRRSVEVARERVNRGDRRVVLIGAEDVNQAAGEHDTSKQEELKRDTLEERSQIEAAFESVKQFCIEKVKVNCFVIQKDRKDIGTSLIEEIVDLRLLHLVRSRVTIADRPGKIYVAYMLDLGQYAGERKRRGLEMVPFWNDRRAQRLRRVGLIYEPWTPPVKPTSLSPDQ